MRNNRYSLHTRVCLKRPEQRNAFTGFCIQDATHATKAPAQKRSQK